MRLLNIYDFTFREFNDADLPPYAIASHRWTKDEITFKDMVKGRRQGSEGYRKVAGFCHYIRKHNARKAKHNALWESVTWLWMDTACLDKSSSAEISESIVSMYRYYRRAVLCYVYLADVDYVWSAARGTYEDNFSQSEWFSRG